VRRPAVGSSPQWHGRKKGSSACTALGRKYQNRDFAANGGGWSIQIVRGARADATIVAQRKERLSSLRASSQKDKSNNAVQKEGEGAKDYPRRLEKGKGNNGLIQQVLLLTAGGKEDSKGFSGGGASK